jgi:hypothetical protein
MNTIDFISESHLGDCIIHADFLNKLIKVNKNLGVNFYVIETHKNQVDEFIENKDQIKTFNRSEAPSTAVRAWMAQYGHIKIIPFDFGLLKLNFYNRLCQELQVKCPYNNIIDLLPDSNLFYENPKDQKWDILLINSDGHSGQTNGLPLDCNLFVERFKHKQIITTKKYKNIPCTIDLNYSVMDIGRLSLKCDLIIGVHTAPWHTVMNRKNYDANKKFFHMDVNNFYSYKNCTTITSLEQLI